jgi:hypothetical protein
MARLPEHDEPLNLVHPRPLPDAIDDLGHAAHLRAATKEGRWDASVDSAQHRARLIRPVPAVSKRRYGSPPV